MNTILPAVTATCGHIFRTGGPTNAKLRLLSRLLSTGNNTADQVVWCWVLSPNRFGVKLMLYYFSSHECFVFQEVSSSQELIWQRTWNTSAHTQQSPWRTWWCPRIPRCWAGWRSRLPAPKPDLSISLLVTLSQRASLYQLLSHWMKSYWNGPPDFSPICIILQKMGTTAWSTPELVSLRVTEKYLLELSIYI